MTTATTTLQRAADHLAALLLAPSGGLRDPGGSDLAFEEAVEPRPLTALAPPHDVWAVDGGQALVADARCVQVHVTRAARTRFHRGACVLEDAGELRACVLGDRAAREAALASLGIDGLDPKTVVDVGLLRDRWEWDAAQRCVAEAEPGGLVLVDGDLEADWRLPATVVEGLLAAAAERHVLVAAVTKHTSLSRGGAPLLGQLELEAEAALGRRARWWAPVARSRGGARIQVVAARLDADARFAFRIDLPAGVDPVEALGRLAAVADDAAFPGYPYALAVADRLAACPGWVRAEAWLQLDDLLARAGVASGVRERAFTDRHRLLERS
ncbi:MAG: DNA double-strand break repair nuclease NurA [Acidimicrobiales bacterium]